MELTKQEQLLIEALREMREPAYNMLLWYSAGVEESYKKSLPIWGEGAAYLENDLRKIEIARLYMKEM